MTVLKEAFQAANQTVQTYLTEIASTATVHLSDLPFRASHLFVFGLTATASLTAKAGDRVENAFEEKVR